MFSFTPSDELRDESPFDADEVLHGVGLRPDWADAPGRVWVRVDGRPDSLRVFGAIPSSCGAVGEGATPLVLLMGDAVLRGNRANGDMVASEWCTRLSPFLVRREAEEFAAALGRPVVNVARPGVFGSSGNHGEPRREREVALVDAVLDGLKDHFGWHAVDLVGQSGGGHLVAALIARRSDVRVAVIASGNVAVRERCEAMGLDRDVTGCSDFVDPIDLVAQVARRPPETLIVLTDPLDSVVAAAHQAAYVARLRMAGVAVEHRLVPALGPGHHVLFYQALLAVAAVRCPT